MSPTRDALGANGTASNTRISAGGAATEAAAHDAQNPRLAAALQYAAAGWPVLPVWWTHRQACACGATCGTSAGKHPIGHLVPNGLWNATTDAQTIREWWSRHPHASPAIALAPAGLIAIDIDLYKDDARKLAELERRLGPLPKTVTQISGSREGEHRLFRAPAFPIRGELGGVTMRGQNYIVVAPAAHVSGNQYVWPPGAAPGEIEVAELPPAWRDALRRDTSPMLGRHRGKHGECEIDWEKLPRLSSADDLDVNVRMPTLTEFVAAKRKLAQGCPPGSRSELLFVVLTALVCAGARDDVLAAVMTTNLLAEGRAGDWSIASHVSDQSDPSQYVERQILRVRGLEQAGVGSAIASAAWRTLGDRDPPARMIELVRADLELRSRPDPFRDAVGRKWKIPTKLETLARFAGSWDCEENVDGKVRRSVMRRDNLAHVIHALVEVDHLTVDLAVASVIEVLLEPDPLPSRMTPDEAIAELNEQHFVVGNIGGKCLVASKELSRVLPERQALELQAFTDFRNRYMHRRVVVESDEGVCKEVQLGGFWLNDPRRRQYEGIIYAPLDDQPGYYNLWDGYGVDPAPGDWSRMRDHIEMVLADGNADVAAYVIKWAAFAVQNPGRRAEAALVLQGEKGSGKGVFARTLKEMFGRHGLQVSTMDHVIGRFNRHLMDCSLLYGDEAYWPGSKEFEGNFKRLITEPTLAIEAKFRDLVVARNCLHVIVTSNAEWVAPATADERRYAVFRVSSAKIGDRSYWQALDAELKDGGREAMLHDLLHWELDGWHPRQIVRTAALDEQKWLTLRGADRWLSELLGSGELPGRALPNKPRTVLSRDLNKSANDHARFRDPRAPVSPHQIARLLRDFGCRQDPDTSSRAWIFPSLSEIREKWSAIFGAPPGGWTNPDSDWVRSPSWLGVWR